MLVLWNLLGHFMCMFMHICMWVLMISHANINGTNPNLDVNFTVHRGAISYYTMEHFNIFQFILQNKYLKPDKILRPKYRISIFWHSPQYFPYNHPKPEIIPHRNLLQYINVSMCNSVVMKQNGQSSSSSYNISVGPYLWCTVMSSAFVLEPNYSHEIHQF